MACRPIVAFERIFQYQEVRFTFSHVRITAEDKLDVIRRLNSRGTWESLDDRRYCTVCKKTFSGRQIEIASGVRRLHRLSLHCPTIGCDSTPEDWRTARASLRHSTPSLIPSRA
jgi:hypothetical protein